MPRTRHSDVYMKPRFDRHVEQGTEPVKNEESIRQSMIARLKQTRDHAAAVVAQAELLLATIDQPTNVLSELRRHSRQAAECAAEFNALWNVIHTE